MLRTVIIAALVATLTACGSDKTPRSAEQAAVKVYRHSMDGAPNNLDPVQSAVIYSNFVVLNTYDTLYSYKYLARPYQLRPNLATAMPEVSEDGLRYTIRLKKGVEFIDDAAFPDGKGREVTAQDVVYSIKRHFDPETRSQGSWLWAGRIKGLDDWGKNGADYGKPVEGLRALDSHTLQIELTRPYPQLSYTLAMGFSGIVPHEAVKHYGREFSIHPVGSGPYRLESFNTAKAVLVPNPKFRQEPVDLKAEGFDPALHAGLGLERIDGRSPPFVERLEIDFVQETASRWNSFNKGNEIQYTSIPVEQVPAVLESKQPIRLNAEWSERYFWKSGVEAGFVYNGFNLDKPEIGYSDDPARNAKNKALRCAMLKAFDWSARNERFYSGIGTVFPGVVPPAAGDLHLQLPRDSVTRDVAGAKKLLAEAGWTPETLPEITYGFTNAVTYRQFFEQWRGFMADIGYPGSKLKPVTFATFGDYNKAIKTSQLDYVSLGWGLDYPDAENTLQLFYGPNHTPGSNNFNYSNPAFDALYEESSVMQPGPERDKLYLKMNQLIIDDCVVASGLSRNRIFLWHKNVIGYPDREILGGFWLKYVDVAGPAAP